MMTFFKQHVGRVLISMVSMLPIFVLSGCILLGGVVHPLGFDPQTAPLVRRTLFDASGKLYVAPALAIHGGCGPEGNEKAVVLVDIGGRVLDLHEIPDGTRVTAVGRLEQGQVFPRGGGPALVTDPQHGTDSLPLLRVDRGAVDVEKQ